MGGSWTSSTLGSMETPQRVELESKIGFLEHTVDALNEVVLRQGRSIEALERRVEALRGRLDVAQEESGARDLEDERPPHY